MIITRGGPALPRPPYEAATAWRRLRALRANPPGLAVDSDRRKVFGMALEQSEQLFRAAGTVDYGTRPILLYYGLNQASRALAAATVADSQQWRFESHGLRVPGKRHESLTSMSVTTNGAERKKEPGRLIDAYQTLADIFDAPAMPQHVRMSALWAALPDLRLQSLPTGSEPTALEFSGSRAGETAYHATLYGLPASLAEAESPQRAVSKYLAKHYPHLAGHKPHPDDGQLTPELGYPGMIIAERTWALSGLEPENLTDRFSVAYGKPNSWFGTRWALPCFPGNQRPTHPYLTWFALLYLLSMAARYNPEVWGAALDVDHAPEAVQLEYALDKASDVGPNLVLSALREYAPA